MEASCIRLTGCTEAQLQRRVRGAGLASGGTCLPRMRLLACSLSTVSCSFRGRVASAGLIKASCWTKSYLEPARLSSDAFVVLKRPGHMARLISSQDKRLCLYGIQSTFLRSESTLKGQQGQHARDVAVTAVRSSSVEKLCSGQIALWPRILYIPKQLLKSSCGYPQRASYQHPGVHTLAGRQLHRACTSDSFVRM